MRLVVLALIAAAVIGPAATAHADDGGLHVCCGGTVSYVGGGSGGISGHVRGPGAPARRPAVVPKKSQPSAVTGGKVQPIKVVLEPENEPVAAGSANTGPLWFLAGAGIAAIGSFVLFGRRRRLPNADLWG